MKEEFTVKAVGIRKDGYGCPVFAKVISDIRLEPGAFRLLYTYTLFENMKGSVISPSVRLLMRFLNVSESTVQRWKRQLEKTCYIRVQKRRGKTNIIWVDFDRGGSQARGVPWSDKEKKKGDLETKPTPLTSDTPSTSDTTPPSPVTPKNLNIRMSTKEKDSDKKSPWGKKRKSSQKTAPDLVRLFFGLIDKGWAKDGFKTGVGIVQNLMDRRYATDVLEEAMRWGVKEKGMMDLTQFGNIVNWYMRVTKTEETNLKRDSEDLGPGAREALKEMRSRK